MKRALRKLVVGCIGEHKTRAVGRSCKVLAKNGANVSGLSLLLQNIAVKEPSAKPPLVLSHYSSFLDTLQQRHGSQRIKKLTTILKDPENEKGFYLRHDVDAHPGGLERLCEEELARGLCSSVAIITATDKYYPTPYALKDFTAIFRRLQKRGVEFGLHTVSWAFEGNARWDCLREEVSLFQEVMGEAPQYFIPHGFLDSPQETHVLRKTFAESREEIGLRTPSFCGAMSDMFLNCVVGASDSDNYWPASEREMQVFGEHEIVAVITHPLYWDKQAYKKYISNAGQSI